MNPFRSGVVALVGRPNAGKSTLLNALLGAKLAITSTKPQTTRDRIAGILTTTTWQAVVLDTPGLHEARTELNRALVRRAQAALAEADVVVWVEDTARLHHVRQGEGPLLDDAAEPLIAEIAKAGKPVVFVPNKLDLVPPEMALPLIDEVRQRLPLAAAVPVSARKGRGLDALKDEIGALLPEGPARHDADAWTEATERFLVAECVREQILHLTAQEVPYATAVEIERFDEKERDTRGLVRIHAAIRVERPSQKAILIGRGGQMIKKIGTRARKEIEALLEARVHLELFVKVEPDWTRTAKGLRRAGYGD